jgi:Xaa-Pro aminopeptidase
MKIMLPLLFSFVMAFSSDAQTLPEKLSPVHNTPHHLDERSKEALEKAITAYDKIRILLADDKLEGVPAAAKELKKYASKASAKAGSELGPDLVSLVNAAKELKSPKDLEAARKSFALASEALISLLTIEAELAKGRYLFECPMVKGYRKWLQTDATLANPYMGNHMKGCGTESSW